MTMRNKGKRIDPSKKKTLSFGVLRHQRLSHLYRNSPPVHRIGYHSMAIITLWEVFVYLVFLYSVRLHKNHSDSFYNPHPPKEENVFDFLIGYRYY